jgi:hypothetical protein
MNLKDAIPSFGNMERWRAIEKCAFFLVVNGMITDRDRLNIQLRLEKLAKKQGFKFIMEHKPGIKSVE